MKKEEIYFMPCLSPEELVQILIFGQAASAACVMDVGTTTGVNSQTIENLIQEQGGTILKKSALKKGN